VRGAHKHVSYITQSSHKDWFFFFVGPSVLMLVWEFSLTVLVVKMVSYTTKQGVILNGNSWIWEAGNSKLQNCSNSSSKVCSSVLFGCCGIVDPPWECHLCCGAHMEECFIPYLQERGCDLNWMFFKQDGAQSCTVILSGYCNCSFPWMKNFEQLPWPPYLHSRNPCDYYLRLFLKDHVYSSHPQSITDLRSESCSVTKILVPMFWDRVQQWTHWAHCEVNTMASGWHIAQINVKYTVVWSFENPALCCFRYMIAIQKTMHVSIYIQSFVTMRWKLWNYAVSSYHSIELSRVNVYEHKLCSRSQTSKQSFCFSTSYLFCENG
jgi:hypothetical protein